MKKNTIIKGTLILTVAGLITRIIGFFYRIYLSNILGTVNLGVYQLIFPVYGVCFTLYASGIQTAVSKMVADEHAKQSLKGGTRYNLNRILKIAMCLSFSIAIVLSVIIYTNADFIAASILKEASCNNSLRILSFVFPVCSFTACINGYYYGLKRPGVPAFTQLFEQIIRVTVVYAIASYIGNGDIPFTCEMAVVGLLGGEIASSLFNILSMFTSKKPFKRKDKIDTQIPIFNPLLKYSLPLTGNHLIISILNSVEAILIPAMLRKYGLSSDDSLSIYGVLTGMSMPFILFPSTITNSLAVLLLPTISEANSCQDNRAISQTTKTCIQYCLIIGIFSTGIFLLFGSALGNLFFANPLAGKFLMILAWLCPFLYISTTLGSIINGLGKTYITLINSVTGLGIRILFVIYMVPQKGIYGYLIGLLVSSLSIALLDYLSLKGTVKFHFDAINWLVKPILIMCVLGIITIKTYTYLVSLAICPEMLLLVIACCAILVLYIISLFLVKSVSLKDFR